MRRVLVSVGYSGLRIRLDPTLEWLLQVKIHIRLERGRQGGRRIDADQSEPPHLPLTQLQQCVSVCLSVFLWGVRCLYKRMQLIAGSTNGAEKHRIEALLLQALPWTAILLIVRAASRSEI